MDYLENISAISMKQQRDTSCKNSIWHHSQQYDQTSDEKPNYNKMK